MRQRQRLTFLNLPIGRGHPFYLDGIIEACNRTGQVDLVRSTEDLFTLLPLPTRSAWRIVRQLYRVGSAPGRLGRLYNSLRKNNNFDQKSLLLRLLGTGLAGRVTHLGSPVIVSHPILVPLLQGKCHLIYQHGELVAPRESLVTGADLVIVPTETVASRFIERGYRSDQLFVSGLCIEPAIIRQARDAYEMRLLRFAGSTPLTGAFFSSGAEPSDHIDKLLDAAQAVVEAGHRAIIFAQTGKRLHRRTLRRLQTQDRLLKIVDSTREIVPSTDGATLVLYENQRQEMVLSSKLFAEFDFYVAPAHERSNWAVGLGLPLFVLEPCKGSFAPLNRELLLSERVAFPLTDNHARSLGARLDTLRHRGDLRELAVAGWQNRSIDGFAAIAAYLGNYLQPSANH